MRLGRLVVQGSLYHPDEYAWLTISAGSGAAGWGYGYKAFWIQLFYWNVEIQWWYQGIPKWLK